MLDLLKAVVARAGAPNDPSSYIRGWLSSCPEPTPTVELRSSALSTTEALQQPANPTFSGALCAWVMGKPLSPTAHHLANAPSLLLPGHDLSSFVRLHL
jgi:hypothetical protein